MNDLKFAMRQLAKNPAFTIVAVLTLALGIGANTAIFTVANGVLLKPLPLPDSERILSLWEAGPGRGFDKVPASAANYLDWKSQAKSFTAISAWQPASINIGAEGGNPERWTGALVHQNFFDVTGVRPVLGSEFLPEHFERGKDGVVILSQGIWRERFASDPNILGRPLLLNGRNRTVLGVMPDGFQTPAQARAWVPKAFSAEELADRGYKQMYVLGRLKANATPEQASVELAMLAANLAKNYPEALANWSAFAHPALEDVAAPMRRPLMVLLGAVMAVLLMACANVANLLLARGEARAGEMAVRTALGAQRRHILRQLGLESALLASLGGIAGWFVAAGLLKSLLAAAPAGLPRLNLVSLDGTALAFTVAVALITAMVFGFAPMWKLASSQPVTAIRASSDQSTARQGWASRLLLIFQVALAVVVLAAGGLLLRSLDRLIRMDIGFRPSELLTARLELPRAKYGGEGRREQFANSLLEKLLAIPGVERAAITSDLPMQGWPQLIMRVEGRPTPRQSEAPTTGFAGISTDYFRTMGVAILSGRDFEASDRADTTRVGIVTEAFVRQVFPTENPLGKRIEVGFSEPPRWIEIVGVARDARNQSLEAQPQAQVFVPLAQQDEFFGPSFSVVVRARPGLANLAASLRQAVWSLDKDQPLHLVKPMTQIVAEQLAQRRFTALLLGVFAALALLLALIGLYGTVAYGVSRRRREIGIRMAIGADRRSVLQWVLGEGFRLALTGVLVGIGGAWATLRLMRNLLYEISPADPLTLGAVSVLLLVAAVLASWLPARRAAGLNPIVALRQD